MLIGSYHLVVFGLQSWFEFVSVRDPCESDILMEGKNGCSLADSETSKIIRILSKNEKQKMYFWLLKQLSSFKKSFKKQNFILPGVRFPTNFWKSSCDIKIIVQLYIFILDHFVQTREPNSHTLCLWSLNLTLKIPCCHLFVW